MPKISLLPGWSNASREKNKKQTNKRTSHTTVCQIRSFYLSLELIIANCAATDRVLRREGRGERGGGRRA